MKSVEKYVIVNDAMVKMLIKTFASYLIFDDK